MAVTVSGQRQIIDIGNFQTLVAEESRLAATQSVHKNPTFPFKYLRDVIKALESIKQTASSSHLESLVDSLVVHLNLRADKIESSINQGMQKLYASSTSSYHYSESSIGFTTEDFSSTSSDEFTNGTILSWNTEIKGIPTEFEMELSEMEIDAINAVLIHGSLCNENLCKITHLAQKLVNSLYLDFIDCEKKVHEGIPFCQIPPEPPLLILGEGPATWTIKHTGTIGLRNVAIVNFPVVNARGGIFAWTTLGHEVSGHDLLSSATLIDQIKNNVFFALSHHNLPKKLVQYWTREVYDNKGRYVGTRIDEIASDLVGVLNLGPAAAVGILGYLKGIFKTQFWAPGEKNDPHPAHILRGVVVAKAVKQLVLQNRREWSQVIDEEVLKDWEKQQREYSDILLDGISFKANEAYLTAKLVADSILNDPLENLGGMSLRQVRVWDVKDQQITEEIGVCLSNKKLAGTPEYCKKSIDKHHAKHIIAAATIESLKTNADHEVIFSNMIKLLERV
ncbi:MAG: hypothetical protein AB7O96_00005 [Pseudobdellovibrionaceae bacterium]